MAVPTGLGGGFATQYDIPGLERLQTQAAAAPLDRLLRQFQFAQQQTQAANLAREQEIRGLMDEIIARYQPEGALMRGSLAALERRKETETGTEMQRLISSGLFGTQAAAGIGTRWESLIGEPTRLTLEDLRLQQLSAAQQAKAGFVERIEDAYPDYAMIAQLAGQTAQPRYIY